jgi:acyl carrier protein
MGDIRQHNSNGGFLNIMNTDEAIAWIADLFEEPVENIQPETLKEDIPAWDSLGVLALMASLDEEFGILLTDEEMQEFEKINDIFDILRRSGKMD